MGENVPVYFKESVSKYHIPLNHLDFSYIKNCKDVKELEKIYKLLKSGEEGTYVELEKCCEEKLKKLHPNSRALRRATPILKLSDMNGEDRKNLVDDLQNWTANMATMDEILKNMPSNPADSQDKPPVRCSEKLKDGNEKREKKKPPPVSKKPVMPRGYKDWDNVDSSETNSSPSPDSLFDIESELKKADDKTEKKKVKKTACNLSETVNVSPDKLEDTKQALATREKDKGNEAFRSSDYNEAVIYYNRSLSICPSDVVYNNRALVYLKLNQWDDAIKDCNKVLESENDNIKALLRRATAYKEKAEHNKALCDLKQVLMLEPENQRAKQIFQEIESKFPTNPKSEIEPLPKKKKGRKMVIEDVEGDADDESAKLKDKKQPDPLINGHPHEIDGTKSLEKSDEVTLSDTTKGKGEGQSRKASKQKKNIKNKMDAKSSMVSDNSLSDQCPASNVKQEKPPGDPPVQTAQLKIAEDPQDKKDPQESISVSCDKKLKTEETLIKPPKVFTQWPLPSHVESVKRSGNDMFQRGRYAEALKFYTDAIDMLQDKSEEQTVNLSLIYSNRAACCLKMGNCQSSIIDCTTSLNLVPHAIKPLLRRASAYETLERYGFAYIDYKNVLAIDSSVEVAQQGSSRCSKVLIQLQGYSWREKLPPMPTIQSSDIPVIQKPAGAETTTVHDPVSTKPAEDESKTSKNKSKKSQKKQSPTVEKQGSTPEKKAPKTLTKDEEFDLMKAQGNQHVKNEEYQKAIECYTKCVQLFPDKVVSYTNRALCYLKLNQANKAESDCDKSLKKEPDNIKAMFRRAQAKKLKQHYRESISDLKNLLTMDPKNSAAKKELEVVKNFWRQELNAMKAHMGDGKSNKDSNKCNQEGDTATSSASGKKGSKQRTRVHVHDVDEDNNSSSSNSSCQGKFTPAPATKPHGKHHKNSTPKKTEGNIQQNQGQSNNKKGCKSANRTAPPPPVAAPHIDKATPYEFLKAWNSLKTVRNTKPYADLLAQVPPEDLPKMISNKLDAAMLNLITRCVSEHYADRGTAELGLQILSNVTKVERFQTIAMFMSSKDKSDLLSLLETLSANQTLYGDKEMQKLKQEYGLK